MLKLMLSTFVIGTSFVTATFFAINNEPHLPQSSASTTQEKQDHDEDTINTELRKQFMRNKLESNKKIVEGLTTTNYEMIKEGATEVTQYVKGQHWFVLKTKEYQQYSRDMEATSKRLLKAAEDRKLDSAALRYFELTMNCMDCHQYISKLKY